MPNGLAVAPTASGSTSRSAGENAIAVLDLVHRKRIGFIPTAWNPTDVDITRDGKRLAITSANAAGRFPRRCAGPVRGRRLLDRRLRLHLGGAAAEHQGRHQRRAARR